MNVPRTHLFIAEDDGQITRAWRRKFAAANIPFFLVTTILEAERIWEAHHPIIALVAIDGYLEDGATITLIRHTLRPRFEGEIISITSNVNFVKNMLEAGCDSHLAKNGAEDVLVRMMRRFKRSLSPSPSAMSSAP